MDPLVAAHILFLGLWGGLVLVEIAFELQMFRGRMPAEAVAELHRITDRLFELPLLVAVVMTGWLLWSRTGFDSALTVKVLAGLGAVLANVVCYVIVEVRAAEAAKAAPDEARLHTLSIALASTIAPGIVAAMVALVIGGRGLGWW